MIPFNKPFLTGKETDYIKVAVATGKISGDGIFTRQCQVFFEQKYGFAKTLLTSSCTDALEMCALLLDIKPGDEVIMPSYTFVSAANAFVLRGAHIVFADSSADNPNIDPTQIETLITSRTRAICVVHYAGVACNMSAIMHLAQRHHLYVIEDAAHAIDAFFEQKPLGGIGHLATFSFHDTKNIVSGEGGMLVINDTKFIDRAEIVREKGTNRSAFFRGEVNKYEWVDLGSSFLPSEITAAFLFAQLEHLQQIQQKRTALWQYYHQCLQPLAAQGILQLPQVPEYATLNGHIFYLVCQNLSQRSKLIDCLRKKEIYAVFHYLPLHLSRYYLAHNPTHHLKMASIYADCLVRLPLFYELTFAQIDYIVYCIYEFFEQKNSL